MFRGLVNFIAIEGICFLKLRLGIMSLLEYVLENCIIYSVYYSSYHKQNILIFYVSKLLLWLWQVLLEVIMECFNQRKCLHKANHNTGPLSHGTCMFRSGKCEAGCWVTDSHSGFAFNPPQAWNRSSKNNGVAESGLGWFSLLFVPIKTIILFYANNVKVSEAGLALIT